MQAQVAVEMSKLQEEPAQQTEQVEQVVSLKPKISSLQKLWKKRWQVSILSHMHLQQAEEVKVQSHLNVYISFFGLGDR